MRRMKWLKGTGFVCGAALLSMLCAQGIALGQTRQLPWRSGEIWRVTQRYHYGYVAQEGAYAIDFAPPKDGSYKGDYGIVAIEDGIAVTRENWEKFSDCPSSWWNPPSRTIRVRINEEEDDTYTHVVDFSVLERLAREQGASLKDGVRVKRGQLIAYMGSSGCTEAAHLHYERLRKIRDTQGRIIGESSQRVPAFEGRRVQTGVSPIKESDGYITADQYLSYNTPLPIHLPGNLIQAKGESDVFLVSVDNGNPARIVKRHVTSPSVFDLNGFDWRRVIEIAGADKGFYLRGDDITSKVTVDGFIEGELVRVKGDAIKVYVVSAGQLHHLAMSAAEFSLLGYSFSQIREVDDVYAKGKEITYSAFVSCFAPVLASPGIHFTEAPGSTDPRRYDKDPLVLFHEKSVVVGSPEDIRAFDKDTKAFLWQTTDARGNMELSDRKI